VTVRAPEHAVTRRFDDKVARVPLITTNGIACLACKVAGPRCPWLQRTHASFRQTMSAGAAAAASAGPVEAAAAAGVVVAAVAAAGEGLRWRARFSREAALSSSVRRDGEAAPRSSLLLRRAASCSREEGMGKQEVGGGVGGGGERQERRWREVK